MTPAEERAPLWGAYRSERSIEARAALMEAYFPYVCRIAHTVPYTDRRVVLDHDDLTMAGVFGLVDAIESYDPDYRNARGESAAFETFAYRRILGAIIDEIRYIDWAPRSVRIHQHAVDTATNQLQHANLREPTTAEIAEKLGRAPQDVEQIFSNIRQAHSYSLDENPYQQAVTSASDDIPDWYRLIPDPDPTPEEIVIRDNEIVMTRQVTSRLPRREQYVVTQYYWHDQVLREIGEALGVTESRACQLHGVAVDRMFTWLREAWA